MRFRSMLLLLLLLGVIIWVWVKPQERFKQMMRAGKQYNAEKAQ